MTNESNTATHDPAAEARERLAEIVHIPDRATAAACFGEAATAGQRSVIPVAEVMYGMGFGWGGGRHGSGEAGTGGGGGGGSRVRGVAVVELSPEGVSVHPIRDETAITLAGMALASGVTAIVSRTLQKLIRG